MGRRQRIIDERARIIKWVWAMLVPALLPVFVTGIIAALEGSTHISSYVKIGDLIFAGFSLTTSNLMLAQERAGGQASHMVVGLSVLLLVTLSLLLRNAYRPDAMSTSSTLLSAISVVFSIWLNYHTNVKR